MAIQIVFYDIWFFSEEILVKIRFLMCNINFDFHSCRTYRISLRQLQLSDVIRFPFLQSCNYRFLKPEECQVLNFYKCILQLILITFQMQIGTRKESISLKLYYNRIPCSYIIIFVDLLKWSWDSLKLFLITVKH